MFVFSSPFFEEKNRGLQEATRPFQLFGDNNSKGEMLFAAYFFDILFQHFNNVTMCVSCYKMEKQAIPHTILVIIESYRSINHSRHLMARHVGIENVSE